MNRSAQLRILPGNSWQQICISKKRATCTHSSFETTECCHCVSYRADLSLSLFFSLSLFLYLCFSLSLSSSLFRCVWCERLCFEAPSQVSYAVISCPYQTWANYASVLLCERFAFVELATAKIATFYLLWNNGNLPQKDTVNGCSCLSPIDMLAIAPFFPLIAILFFPVEFSSIPLFFILAYAMKIKIENYMVLHIQVIVKPSASAFARPAYEIFSYIFIFVPFPLIHTSIIFLLFFCMCLPTFRLPTRKHSSHFANYNILYLRITCRKICTFAW